jgi:hypothetical protein
VDPRAGLDVIGEENVFSPYLDSNPGPTIYERSRGDGRNMKFVCFPAVLLQDKRTALNKNIAE